MRLRLSWFPFLDEAREILEGLDLSSLASDPAVVEHCRRRLEAAVSGTEIHIADADLPDEVAVGAYVLSRVVAGFADPAFAEMLAEHDVKRFNSLLGSGTGERRPLITDEGVLELASRLGVAARLSGGRFLMRFEDYVKLTGRIGGPKWLLVNRPIRGGWVRLPRKDFVRVISEALRDRLRDVPRMRGDPPAEIADMVRFVNAEIAARRAKWGGGPEAGIGVEDFPPCMAAIVAAIRAGENVPHTARFAIAAFLLAIGWTEEQVVDLFRASPDFKERVARYQVHHIASRGYSVPSCDRMRSWGLCPASCGVKNPIQAARRAARLRRRTAEKGEIEEEEGEIESETRERSA